MIKTSKYGLGGYLININDGLLNKIGPHRNKSIHYN